MLLVLRPLRLKSLFRFNNRHTPKLSYMKPILKLSALLLVGGLLIPAPLVRAAAPALTPPASQAMTMPAIETLPNGVVFVPTIDRTAPRVAISLLIGEGAAGESAADAGWRRLLIGAIARQAPQGYELGATETARQESLVNAAAALGGTISVSVGDDVVDISVQGESAGGPDLLKLALTLLQQPRLSDETLDEARTRQLDRVGAEDLDSTTRIDSAIRNQVFRDKSGNLVAYGLPDNGTEKSINSLDNAKLRELQDRLARAPLTVSAAGDVDVVALRKLLAQLPAREPMALQKPEFARPRDGAPSLKVRELAVEGAYVLVSYPLPDFEVADAPALRILVAALSDAKGARLPARLSGALVKGAPQAETVSAQWLNRRYASEVLLSAQTTPSSVEGVKNVLLDEVNKLRQQTLSGQEIERARAYARGDWALDRQTLRSRAFLTGLPIAVGAPSDADWQKRLDAVTVDDVKRVANKYLGPYAVALVMPKE